MEELIRFKRLFDVIRYNHNLYFKHSEWISINGKLFGDGISFNLRENGHILVMFYGCHYSSDMGSITVHVGMDKDRLDEIYEMCEKHVLDFLSAIKSNESDVIKNKIEYLQSEIETLKSQLQ